MRNLTQNSEKFDGNGCAVSISSNWFSKDKRYHGFLLPLLHEQMSEDWFYVYSKRLLPSKLFKLHNKNIISKLAVFSIVSGITHLNLIQRKNEVLDLIHSDKV